MSSHFQRRAIVPHLWVKINLAHHIKPYYTYNTAKILNTDSQVRCQVVLFNREYQRISESSGIIKFYVSRLTTNVQT